MVKKEKKGRNNKSRLMDLIFLKNLVEIQKRLKLTKIPKPYLYQFLGGKYLLTKNQVRKIVLHLEKLGFVKVAKHYVLLNFRSNVLTKKNEGRSGG